MNPTMQLATGAAIVAAIIEYPLGQKYPLATPVSLPVRMAVAGGLAFVGVLVASSLLKGADEVRCACGHEWPLLPEDPNPMLCHACGHTVGA